MNHTFSFLSLNIEQRKHLPIVFDYLTQYKPDVICLQEIFEDSFHELTKQLGYHSTFAPRAEYYYHPAKEGMAILSRYPIISHDLEPYDQFTEIPERFIGLLTTRPKNSLQTATLDLNGKPIVIANTHFTWSFGGEVTEEQRVNFQHFLSLLEQYPEFVLCGDFNTPRGNIIFDTLATKYTDNIPAEITTTIDPELHRAGPLQLVVDGLFTTPAYNVTDVTILTGLSDHCGIGAIIQHR